VEPPACPLPAAGDPVGDELVLVRHGQTALNAEGRLAGRLDVDLTDLGARQATAVATAVLDAADPARVVSSPLQRAVRTAAAFGREVIVDGRWIELDYGEYDGRPLGEVPASLWDRWRADAGFIPPGGESLRALGARVREACSELAAVGGTTVVVSHVSPIKAAVAWALGVGDEVSWRMYLAPASISVIGLGERGPSLRAFNVTTHL
jgi:broad specificity phosphatase PhoE